MADTRHLVNYLIRVVHFQRDEFLPGRILKRAFQSVGNDCVRTPLNATLISPSARQRGWGRGGGGVGLAWQHGKDWILPLKRQTDPALTDDELR